eukprot:CAMPEP_0204215702 /NCGR_PEP_ID=MMETSP0361-20130328/77633_1 /ASSEMBLY_ACC=CAM_ASM_000343 /TAXON_ID=268821 /ORGANISM="Scrippsiella Hangoei, Strain SHTV-5" /LENGTH=73 /DNA_ID=CAMNT_0051180471 /DNA_START=60 /DNA_END=277 /DNA_ORIENTATION=+
MERQPASGIGLWVQWPTLVGSTGPSRGDGRASSPPVPTTPTTGSRGLVVGVHDQPGREHIPVSANSANCSSMV